MPAHPKPAAMSADEFREIIEGAGLSTAQAVELLEVRPSTVYRWLAGETPISEEKAALIRSRIKAKKT